MSNNLVDQFGFNVEDFAEQEETIGFVCSLFLS